MPSDEKVADVRVRKIGELHNTHEASVVLEDGMSEIARGMGEADAVRLAIFKAQSESSAMSSSATSCGFSSSDSSTVTSSNRYDDHPWMDRAFQKAPFLLSDW
jgi:hypothetical protein